MPHFWTRVGLGGAGLRPFQRIDFSPSTGAEASAFPRFAPADRASMATAVEDLRDSALRHRAVRHPFLEAFARGDFRARTRDIARTFAAWYDGYSRWFPRYLGAVVGRREKRDHTDLLRENLAEEQGELCPDERETLVALGIDPATVDGAADRWRRSEPILLSDFTARPFLTEWCEPVQGADVLDLGCGEGYVARKLRERGAGSVRGIDVSSEMIERARAQEAGAAGGVAIRFEAGDATELAHLEDASFDLVVAVFLFNYQDRAAMTRTMGEVVRVLRPGGRFVFSVPHPSLAFLRPEERPFYFSRGTHGYFGGRDTQFEGEIWRRDGEPVRVRCVHKTFDDDFVALKEAGFRTLPDVKELHATPEHLAFDPGFFEPLREQPLHVAFRLER